jgi:hypothetical protein
VVSRTLKLISAAAVVVVVVWIVGCAVGTRQEFWVRPTAEIHGDTNIVSP